MYWDTLKSIDSCTLYRQSIPFIEYTEEKETRVQNVVTRVKE